jgi:hypothetical protein
MARERVLKAIISPTDTSTFWAAQPFVILPVLVPASAASRLMTAGRTISLAGVQTVKVPYQLGGVVQFRDSARQNETTRQMGSLDGDDAAQEEGEDLPDR